MAIYKNIDGTTKPSFKIGTRGITIVPTEVTKGADTLMKIAIHEKGKDPRYLLYENEVEFPKEYCEKIEQNESKTETKFYIRGIAEPIIVSTLNVGVKGPEGAVENNLAAFKGTTGQEIKDSGVSVRNNITLNAEGNGASTEIPTAEAVVNYVGSISELLRLRVQGYSIDK